MSCGKLNRELNFDLRNQQIEQSMAYNLSSILILTSTKENWLELSLERETTIQHLYFIVNACLVFNIVSPDILVSCPCMC